ncbi:MAG TPA: hypothetical protein VH597_13950 [Verrucomicrobiae bacterium]|jgi:hypothetical protein|nr:hypothetical protein [Verrucomicrobiae bacterium]
MSARWKITALTILVAITFAVVLWYQQPAPQRVPVKAPLQSTAVSVAQTQPQESAASPAETAAPTVHSVAPAPLTRQLSKTVPTSTSPNTKPPKEPLSDPEARDALALVGLDPNAEQYWLEAIYDTSLPDKEREDLMEDLNEVGFADPANVTANDLPLIVNRLKILEELKPTVNDPFMSEHLGEAYKDLANMYAKAVGQ